MTNYTALVQLSELQGPRNALSNEYEPDTTTILLCNFRADINLLKIIRRLKKVLQLGTRTMNFMSKHAVPARYHRESHPVPSHGLSSGPARCTPLLSLFFCARRCCFVGSLHPDKTSKYIFNELHEFYLTNQR